MLTKRVFLILTIWFSVASSSGLAKPNVLSDSILQGSHREAAHLSRDKYRNPNATLAFFEVSPTMSVVEIWPGAKGWYTELLAPLLRDKGKLYAAHFDSQSTVPFFKKSLRQFQDKLATRPDIYRGVTVTTLQPPQQTAIAPDGSVDRVLTFRNVHNWVKAGTQQSVFNAMFKALKPGGILGVVEHRGVEGMSLKRMSASGYVPESYMIQLAENAGFEFLAKSEINANPRDIKRYPEGVWTLPPTLRLKEQDRQRYLVIGESDRMTLKFIKPTPR